MRLTTARIKLVQDNEVEERERTALESVKEKDGQPLNIYRTIARAPRALSRFLGWGGYVMSRRNSLPIRQREIVILRIGFLCKSGYEFTQHTRIWLESGQPEAEIAAIKRGPTAPNWTPAEKALLQACDELHADQFITDTTWAALKRHFDEKQCMDVVFTSAQYTQVSMILNSFGVQLDPGQKLDPDLKFF